VRFAPLILCAFSCATTQKSEDTEVFVFDVVTQHCRIPDLKTFFEFDSVQIDRADHADLNALAKCLTDGPLSGSKVELIGHSDPMGSKKYNKKLSLRRAEEVARYLAKRGVPDERISVRAAGEADGSPKHQARRVDIKLIDCTIDPKQKCADQQPRAQ
jgi:outer membrane protein OmpA-like peptidoglycan-associated protein